MSSPNLLSEAETLSRILSALPAPAQTETIPLDAALHRRCARALHATIALPGFDNSMMDGYALRAEASPGELELIGTQPAGRDLGLRIEQPDQAVRVFTGAPIPAGADAVIMQEDTRLDGHRLVCLETVQPGENIRPRGSDLCAGQLCLQAGDLLTPARIALLASQGRAHVEVFHAPRIAVLTTGDELVPPGPAALHPGQLFNSNAPMLAALLRAQGLTAAASIHVEDALPATTSALAKLAAEHDVILVSGGASVGERDFVRPALTALGLPPQLWRIRVKPGKPFLFAHRQDPRPLFVFGLPGNPVSAFITFHLFVRPALLKLGGAPQRELSPLRQPAILTQNLDNPGDRPLYLRGQLRDGRFFPSAQQRSDALFALSQANALLRLEESGSLPAGAAVEVMPL